MTAQRARGRVRVDRDAGEQLGGGSLTTLKRFVVGRPLATHAQDSELLPKRIALPVFSSDAVSSTAYGTEVMLTVLVPVAGVAAFGYLVPLSLVLIGVLTLLVLSYRQTIFAYPNGGGSYIVSRENLGTNPSLVACAALLVDYTLNVAVSAAAGAAAISSAITPLQDHPIALSVGLVAVIMFANLRGLREAGRLFALPVYTYVAVLTLLIVDGLIRSFTGSLHQLPVNHTQLNAFTHNGALVTGVTLFALMKAFSSGAVALSGVEAISNGVPAFREPKSRNAATTMIWTGLFLGGPLLGLAVLTNRLRPTISTKETLISILGDHVFGRGSPLVHHLDGVGRVDPVPVREHVLRRLPTPVVDRRPRRVPPPAHRGAATAWCSRTGSSRWRRARSCCCLRSTATSTRWSRCSPSASSPRSRSPRSGWCATTGDYENRAGGSPWPSTRRAPRRRASC